jgi:glycerophosphoryl diester phosphodiesterase
MQALHEAGRRVFAWTVDEPGDVRRLLDLGGVAGIVTNDLVAVRRVIDQASSSTCSRQTAHTAEV